MLESSCCFAKFDWNMTETQGTEFYCMVVCSKCWTDYLILLYTHQWFLIMFFLARADIRVTFGSLLWSCLRNLTDMWSNQLPFFSGYLQSVLIAVFLFLFKLRYISSFGLKFADLLQIRGCEGCHCYMWGPVSWFKHCDSWDSVWALDSVWSPWDLWHSCKTFTPSSSSCSWWQAVLWSTFFRLPGKRSYIPCI